MARATNQERLEAIEQALAGLNELSDLNRSRIQGTLGNMIRRLHQENEELQGTITSQQQLIANLHAETRQLQAETRRQGRMQWISGIILTIVGATIGWLLAALGNPAQAMSLLLPLHH
jgi:hypothetical protein